jgi:hypothetical protein
LRIRLVWVPSFVVGTAAATASAVAVALLLYSGEGMLRSLTLIIAVELVAFGVGLAAPPESGRWPAVVEALRRRWLAALLTFLAASVFTVVWTFGEGFSGDGRSQALGLAMLGGLPLYACGRLLAGISTAATAAINVGRSSPGAFASLGAALGVLITGSSGLSRLGAPSLLLVVLVLLSGAALVQGSVLGDVHVAPDEAGVGEDA